MGILHIRGRMKVNASPILMKQFTHYGGQAVQAGAHTIDFVTMKAKSCPGAEGVAGCWGGMCFGLMNSGRQ